MKQGFFVLKKKHVKIFNLFEILIMLLLLKVLFANKTVGVVEFLVFFCQ